MPLRRIILIILFFGSVVIAPQWAHALTRQLPLSGQLLTPAKTAVPDGDYTMRFSIYTADRTISDSYPSNADSASRIWTETQTVKVERGLWKVILGSATDLPGTLNFETGNYYLGIRINTDPEMVPRKKILPVPQALNSEFVGGAKPGTGVNNILQLDSAGAINIAGNITTAGILQGANLIIGTAIQLPANSILTADIMDGTISTIDLADGLITGVKISDSAVSGAKLADSAVTVSKIGDGAITTVKISDGSVATSKINDLAVTTLKIADSAITTAKLADSSITTAKIADMSITAAKLFTGDLHFQNTDTGTTSLAFGLGAGTAVGTNNFSITASNAANKPAVRYNGATGKWQISNDGTTFADIGSSLSSSLQAGYDAGNTITTTDARNILFNLADTATDSNFLINIQGTGNSFQIQDAGTPIFTVADGGLATFGGNINLSGNRIVSASRIDGYASGSFLYTAVDLRAVYYSTSLALDSSNYPHVLYYTNNGNDASIADWDGIQWTITDFDTTGDKGISNDLVIDGSGVKHAVYRNNATNDSDLIYAKYVGSGGTGCTSAAWSCTTVDSVNDVGTSNSIDVDGSNVPHISYYDTTNGDLRHAWYVGSGGTGCTSAAWSCEIVESANTIGSASSIAINRASNDIHITYYDATNGDLKYVKYSGGAWGASVILDGRIGSPGCIATGCGARDTGNYSYGSNLVLTASGNPRVAYFDDTADDLYYAYSNDGGISWATEKIDGGSGVTGTGCTNTAISYGQYPSLTLDSSSNPHISYYDFYNYNLRYASNNGSAWTCQTLDSANSVGLYSSIKMTSADKAYISYQDSTNTDLKIVSNNYPKLNIYSDVVIMGETGNLGIGVLQPTERLDVAGNIKATGNITSSLSVVAANGFSTTGGSNYIPTLYGGSAASGNFTLYSTSSGYGKGNIFINPGGKLTVIGNNIPSASLATAGLQITPNYLYVQYRYYNPGTGYTYSGNTGEANSYGGTPFTLVSAMNDIAYFGSHQPFGAIDFDIAMPAVGGAVVWQYWNGATWTTLTTTDGTSNFTTDGAVSFTPPVDWTTVNSNVNSITTLYWIRANVTTTGYTTAPTANSTIIGRFGTAAAPLVTSLIQPAGIADSTTWSATGTMLGINTPLSFNGNLMDLKVAGSSKFVVTSAGNVGIGTASPGYKLAVSGADGNLFDIQNVNAATLLTNNVASITGIEAYSIISGVSSGNHFSIDTLETLGGTSTITFNGNLLRVNRNSQTISASASATIAGSVAAFMDNCNQVLGTCTSSADVVQIQQSYASNTGAALNVSTAATGAGSLALRVNDDGTFTDSTPFVIDAAGNVGIGTASPTERLSILQNAAGTGILGLWDGANNNVVAVADGGGATFKPAAFDAVYRDNGAASFTDNSIEAKTSGGTTFTILSIEASSNDEFYVGLDHPFSTIYVDTQNTGATVTLSAQYWNGAWNALAITDNTSNLTVDGTITFTAQTDWATTLINGATKYWVRLRSPGTNITSAPNAYSISPTSGSRLAVYGQTGDANPTLFVSDRGRVSIGSPLSAYTFDVRSASGYTTFAVDAGGASPSIVIGGSNDENQWGSTAGNHSIRFKSSGVEGIFYWNPTDDRYYFTDYNSNKSPIIAGMLGLNTATPTAALQVQATSTSSGATTMTASNGTNTFSTTASVTVNVGDYIIPTTTTGQARSVTIGGTGTGPFTVTPAFSADVTAETFTIYPAITNLTDNSGNTGLFLQGSTRNVGIGTMNPTKQLEIMDGSVGVDIYGISGNGAGYLMSNGGDLILGTNGTNRAVLYGNGDASLPNITSKSSGNVGIGTAIPAATLEINGPYVAQKGQLYVKGISGNGYIVVDNDNTANESGVIIKSAGTPRWYMYTPSSGGNLLFNYTGGTQVMALSATGVGIGNVTSPSANLDIRQIADGNQVIYARRNTDTTPAGNFVQFQNAAGSASLFTIDINGNLGIGTTPSSGSGITINSDIEIRAGATNDLYFTEPAGFRGNFIYDTTDNAIIIGTANASNVYTQRLKIYGEAASPNAEFVNIAGVGINTANSLSGNLDIRQIADGNQVIYARRNTDTTPTGNFIQFQNTVPNATLFEVDVNGNVGIGRGSTTTYSLEVSKGVAGIADLVRLQNSNGPTNNYGTQLLFSALRTTSGLTNIAGVSGIITDITDTAYKGALIFSTANNAAPVEQARIDYLGNVSFGVNVTGGTTTIDLGGAGTGNAVCHTTQTGTDNEGLVDCTSAPAADYAEMYPVAGGVEYGDIVAVGTKMLKTKDGDNIVQLVKSNTPYQSTTIGIVSNNYGDFTSAGYNIRKEDNPMPVALNGRVPVKVSLENGPIAVGDPLTSSSVPGVAMKATGAGYVIGKALEPFDESGKILVFVSPGWFTPLTGPLVQGGDNKFDTINVGGLAIAKDLVVTGLARIKGDLIVEGKVRGDLEVEGVVKTKGIVGGWRSYENHFLSSKFENDFTVSVGGASWEYHKIKLAADALAGSKATLDHSFNFKPADDEIGATWRFMIKTDGGAAFSFGLRGDDKNYAVVENGTNPNAVKFATCLNGECATTDNIAIDPSLENHNYIIMIKAGEAKLLIDGQEYAKHATNVPADSILHFYESVTTNTDVIQSITLDYLGVIVGRYEPF